MKTHTLTLAFEKATKNTMKFTELQASGLPPVIGVLYIQKWACPEGTGPNTRVSVTINIDNNPVGKP